MNRIIRAVNFSDSFLKDRWPQSLSVVAYFCKHRLPTIIERNDVINIYGDCDSKDKEVYCINSIWAEFIVVEDFFEPTRFLSHHRGSMHEPAVAQLPLKDIFCNSLARVAPKTVSIVFILDDVKTLCETEWFQVFQTTTRIVIHAKDHIFLCELVIDEFPFAFHKLIEDFRLIFEPIVVNLTIYFVLLNQEALIRSHIRGYLQSRGT